MDERGGVTGVRNGLKKKAWKVADRVGEWMVQCVTGWVHSTAWMGFACTVRNLLRTKEE